ncbi:MAG TPA: glycosyltransferase family 10 [Candidatus Babeliales bacterium]|nr:glycosyltransferase family 10 [Candidatus Babeliales bacterium]
MKYKSLKSISLVFTRILLLHSALIIVAQEKLVILIPFDQNDTNDTMLHPDPNNYWYQLKQACAKAGYLLTSERHAYLPEQVHAIIAFNAPRTEILQSYPKAKKILYTWEPPSFWPQNFDHRVHNQYDIVATWHDGLVNNKKYRKFNYALLFSPPTQNTPFSQKKLCCMMAGNKNSAYPHELYSKRLSLIRFFEKNAPHEFDLYGSGWPRNCPVYRGFTPDKTKTMDLYKFAVIYENMSHIPGYITEKIFDAFSAGCVPVYWGASNITDYIPRTCFVAREDFTSDFDLYQFIKNMPQETYQEYLNAIDSFLRSEKAYVFSREQFITTFINLLNSL